MKTMLSVMLAPSQIPVIEELGPYLPLYGSYKLDGHRAVVMPDGRILTRSAKPHPNRNLPAFLRDLILISESCGLSFDGELCDTSVPFNELQSMLRDSSASLSGGLRFYVFDALRWGEEERTFEARQHVLKGIIKSHMPDNVILLEQVLHRTPSGIEAHYTRALNQGYEGLILRGGESEYKHGRATFRSGSMYKLKAFDTIDAKVIGYEQRKQLKDDAPDERNELGRKKRTHKAEHYGLADTVGCLRVRDELGRTYTCGWGRGWTDERKLELWRKIDECIGKWVEVSYMPFGTHELPRMPRVIRFRDDKD